MTRMVRDALQRDLDRVNVLVAKMPEDVADGYRAPLVAALMELDDVDTLLVKLGSIMVHAEELLEPGAHEFDVAAIRGLLGDPDVRAWRAEAEALALLPVKR